MTIPIADPRTVTVELEASRREKGAYLFHSEVAAFLQDRSWEIVKHAAGFVHCRPPAGEKPPFTFAITVPSREQIESLTSDLHKAGKPWQGQIGEWPASYFRHLHFQWAARNLFTDEEVPLPPSPERWTLLVGHDSIWSASVFFENGRVEYCESLQLLNRPQAECKVNSATRNPEWVRDELTLVLDLYFTWRGDISGRVVADACSLSDVLLSLPIHQGVDLEECGDSKQVMKKYHEFESLDPERVGLSAVRGKKFEKQLWGELAQDRDQLRQLAEGIKTGYTLPEANSRLDSEATSRLDPDEETFPEGRILYRLHRYRERDPEVIKLAKKAWKKQHGKLTCCICPFDFAARYGEIGEDYIEAHHTKPLHELSGETETKVSDLAPVCANCHRMLHRRKHGLGIDGLKAVLKRVPPGEE